MKRVYALIGAVVLAGVLGSRCQDTHCADEDIACWKALANEEWKAEHGEFQPDLTPEQEAWLFKHYPDTDFHDDIAIR